MAEKENSVNKTYDLLIYIIPHLEKFPRSQRFLLADRIETRLLDLLESLVAAYYAPAGRKKHILESANRCLEGSRYLVRLSHDLRFLSDQKYGVISEKVDEIGRMIGGWTKVVT
jgi:hypothetical protein